MDDLEKAVLILYAQDATAIDRVWRDEADKVVASARADSRCLDLCCERFEITEHDDVRFWCVKTLHEVRRSRELAAIGAAACPQSAAASCCCGDASSRWISISSLRDVVFCENFLILVLPGPSCSYRRTALGLSVGPPSPVPRNVPP